MTATKTKAKKKAKKRSTKKAISKPIETFRSGALRAAPAGRIDRDGGMYEAGVIHGVSVITRGEALGHRAWIDGYMLEQVAEAINMNESGVKSRFAHPGMSGDGIGKHVGRFTDAEVVNGRVLADLHLSQSSASSPDGNLQEYILNLADEDPEAFGVSIAFAPDADEEDRYAKEYADKSGVFQSPDEDNEKNYRHVRLGKLTASDIVDEPAANPNGLFMRGQEIPQAAEELFSYALGLTEDCPGDSQFGVDPDRLKGFAARFLETKGLSIAPQTTESIMDFDELYSQNKEAIDARLNDEHSTGYGEAKSDLDAMIEACGGDINKGYAAFKEGKSLTDARSEYSQSVADELAETKAKLAEAEKRAAEFDNGGDELNLSNEAEIKDVPSEDDEKKAAVKKRASKIKEEYARNAYIASCGYDPTDFTFED